MMAQAKRAELRIYTSRRTFIERCKLPHDEQPDQFEILDLDLGDGGEDTATTSKGVDSKILEAKLVQIYDVTAKKILARIKAKEDSDKAKGLNKEKLAKDIAAQSKHTLFDNAVDYKVNSILKDKHLIKKVTTPKIDGKVVDMSGVYLKASENDGEVSRTDVLALCKESPKNGVSPTKGGGKSSKGKGDYPDTKGNGRGKGNKGRGKQNTQYDPKSNNNGSNRASKGGDKGKGKGKGREGDQQDKSKGKGKGGKGLQHGQKGPTHGGNHNAKGGK